MILIPFFNYIRACMHDTTVGTGRYTVFLLLLNLPVWCGAQVKLDYYVSNAGNDSFPGTSIAFPKKTISAMAPALQKTAYSNGIVKLGLKAGDLFEEGLVTTYPIEVNGYSAGTAANNALAVLNGTKIFNAGWLKRAGTNFTFNQSIPYDGFLGYGRVLLEITATSVYLKLIKNWRKQLPTQQEKY